VEATKKELQIPEQTHPKQLQFQEESLKSLQRAQHPIGDKHEPPFPQARKVAPLAEMLWTHYKV
jgi:hypothetical protein